MPPAWKAARGSKDSPIMTQKMASEPKPQARSTVSKPMRRMCSMPCLAEGKPDAAPQRPRTANAANIEAVSASEERPARNCDQRRTAKKLPIAGSVRIAVAASHSHNDASVESSFAPARRS